MNKGVKQDQLGQDAVDHRRELETVRGEAEDVIDIACILVAHGFSDFRGRSSRPWARRGNES